MQCFADFIISYTLLYLIILHIRLTGYVYLDLFIYVIVITYSRSAILAADKNLDAEVKTSEYGSADPSPTDSSQSVPLPFSESKVDIELKAEVR